MTASGRGRINWRRVFAGGVLATVTLTALGFLVWLILLRGAGAEGAYLLPPTGRAIALWGAAIYGICTSGVWLYAAVRPRFGPGPRTAAVAGLAVWVVTSLTDGLWILVLSRGGGPGPPAALVASIACYAVIFPLAIMAGAWLYREGGSAR